MNLFDEQEARIRELEDEKGRLRTAAAQALAYLDYVETFIATAENEPNQCTVVRTALRQALTPRKEDA